MSMPRRPRAALPVLAVAGALALTACSGSEDDAPPPAAQDAPAETAPEHTDPAPEPDDEVPAPRPDEGTTEPSVEPEPEPEPEPDSEPTEEAEPDQEVAVAALTGPTWHLTTVTTGDETVRADDSVSAAVTFGDPPGVLGVQACNAISGTAADAADADRLTLALGTSTLMACPGLQGEVEDAMRDFLDGEADYTVTDDQLTLTKDNGDTMVLVAE